MKVMTGRKGMIESSESGQNDQRSAVVLPLVSSSSSASTSSSVHSDPEVIRISNGPLSYKYSLDHVELHFGREMTRGSEHSIDGIRFPAEIQLYFFNSQLYNNWDEAVTKAHGVTAIALLIQLNPDPKSANPQLKRITHALKNITTKGETMGFETVKSVQLCVLSLFTSHFPLCIMC